jgi:hypothetical protein
MLGDKFKFLLLLLKNKEFGQVCPINANRLPKLIKNYKPYESRGSVRHLDERGLIGVSFVLL